MAHYGVFRQELATSYPTYGNALWEPDPGGQYNTVEVGDVGFIRRGYFQRLFNVLLPKDHPSHRNPTFVPEDHQQLVTIHDHIVRNEIRTGSRQNSLHFCSQYVTLDSRGRGTLASGPEDDSQITFSCNGKQGALLSLPVPAQGQDTVAFGDFGKWMIKHIDAWFAFARGLGLGINRMEDIILVTGRHLTKSWVNVAFTQRRPDAGVSFDVQVSGHSRISLEQEYVRGGDLKLGPTGRDLPENQCIFIRGFRVVRILGMWPKLRGQAEPAPDAGDQEPEPEVDPQLELISVPDDSNVKHPDYYFPTFL
ncbi:hypothetical protein F5888DRAFT_494244 [Russula emetica]|nr:hypothetical protein F5888DRAFT_494244 [Russula emetica]